MSRIQDLDLRLRKFRDAALVLPFAGAFLVMPPFIRTFVIDGSLAGIPVIIVYLFSVWFLLILCAWRLAGPLCKAMDAEQRSTRDIESQEG